MRSKNQIPKAVVIGVQFNISGNKAYYNSKCQYFEQRSKQWINTGWTMKELESEDALNPPDRTHKVIYKKATVI